MNDSSFVQKFDATKNIIKYCNGMVFRELNGRYFKKRYQISFPEVHDDEYRVELFFVIRGHYDIMDFCGELIFIHLSKFDLYLELCQCRPSFLVRVKDSLNVLYRIVFLSNTVFNFVNLTIGSFTNEI